MSSDSSQKSSSDEPVSSDENLQSDFKTTVVSKTSKKSNTRIKKRKSINKKLLVDQDSGQKESNPKTKKSRAKKSITPGEHSILASRVSTTPYASLDVKNGSGSLPNISFETEEHSKVVVEDDQVLKNTARRSSRRYKPPQRFGYV